MKFCYNTNFTLPKQCQRSRSVFQDGSRSLGLFWNETNPSYNRRNTVNRTCTYPAAPKNTAQACERSSIGRFSRLNTRNIPLLITGVLRTLSLFLRIIGCLNFPLKSLKNKRAKVSWSFMAHSQAVRGSQP